MNFRSAIRFNQIFWMLILAGMTVLGKNRSLIAAEPVVVKSPLSPEDSLKHFQIAPGLKIELVAAEPEVIDPVSIAFDERGTLWAVEMTDYPNGPQPGQPPLSRIRALQDRDGDGRYETSRVFADKLLFATGVQPWKGGVIVTLAGEVAWFHDSDGDGTADVRQTWFRGFAEQNPQLRANHPRWGFDNRIYIANGLRGGVVQASAETWRRELPPVPLNGFDFRCNPFTGEAEPVSGVGQFGLTFNDFGQRFVCSNRNPCRQILLEDRYLKRNPLLAVKDVGSDAVPSGADSHVYPISRAWTTSTTHAGQFTAACGVTIYRGSALPGDYYGNALTCEPTGNLVHREILRPAGVQFQSEPQASTTEFLASPDEWFRPVDLANGPDGALYVVDMYRAVIEHPEWVPDELKHRPDERDGSDKGRIYRIVSKEVQSTAANAKFTPEITTAALIHKLESTDSWQAETAARVLVERQLAETQALLVQTAHESASPLVRWRAYRLLSSFPETKVEQLQAALHDSSPHVRELGVLLVEGELETHPDLLKQVVELAADPAPRVRFQVALSLGPVASKSEVVAALAQIMTQDAQDEWTRNAVLASIGQNPAAFFQTWVKSQQATDAPAAGGIAAGGVAALQDVANLLGAQQDPAATAAALKSILAVQNDRLRAAGFLGLCRGIQRRGTSARTVIAELAAQDRPLATQLETFFKQAASYAATPDGVLPQRLETLAVLEFSHAHEADAQFVLSLAVDPERQIAIKAIDILATYDTPGIHSILMYGYSLRTPEVRRAILRAMLRTPERVRHLLESLENKDVNLVELDPNQVKALMNHADPAIRQAAQKILAAAIPQARKVVLEQYQRALAIEAKPDRGRAVFEKNCATCHQIGKLGVVVGPDIADSRTKTPAQLLVDILSPNQAIDNNYVSYTVVTKDGRVETGFIANETAASITLKQPENKTQLILRQDIDELRSNGVSIMPEGLEKNITVEQMADLISFVKNWRYLDGQIPIKVSQP